jgi:hypothetical protein
MPLLAVIACSLVTDLVDFQHSRVANVAMSLIYGIAVSWLAITIHRLVLLDEPDARAQLDSASLRRLATFVGIGIAIWVLYFGVTMIVANGMLMALYPPRYIPAGTDQTVLPPHTESLISPEWILRVAGFVAYWFVGRVSLMLPAIAVDRKPDLVAAWQASRRNGWRLTIVVGLLPWCLQQFTNLLYRDGATVVEFSVLVVLATLLIIIEVVALSLSYWELTSPEPPPTPPPS